MCRAIWFHHTRKSLCALFSFFVCVFALYAYRFIAILRSSTHERYSIPLGLSNWVNYRLCNVHSITQCHFFTPWETKTKQKQNINKQNKKNETMTECWKIGQFWYEMTFSISKLDHYEWNVARKRNTKRIERMSPSIYLSNNCISN